MTKRRTMRAPVLMTLVGVLALATVGAALAELAEPAEPAEMAELAELAENSEKPQEDPPGAGMAFERSGRAEGPGWGRGRRGPGGPEMGAGWTHPGGPGAHGLRMALRNLDLSDSQRDEIRAIFEGEREQMRAHHEHMRGLGAELRDQIETDPANEDAVRAKASEIARVGVEIAVLRARQAGQVRSILTPEQLDELEEIKAQRRELRGGPPHRFERRRGGSRTQPRG